jgi:hypothetical protein
MYGAQLFDCQFSQLFPLLRAVIIVYGCSGSIMAQISAEVTFIFVLDEICLCESRPIYIPGN